MEKYTRRDFEQIAQEYKQSELWEYLSDADVFGLKLRDGRIAYCVVMGNSNVLKGLCVYIGSRGFKSYLDTLAYENVKDCKMQFEMMASFDCIQVAFSEEGHADSWAQHPGIVPRPENCTEEEIDILCQALVAAISLNKFLDIADGDVVSFGFDEYEEYPTNGGGKKVPLLRKEGNGYICETTELPAYDMSDEDKLKEMADEAVFSKEMESALSYTASVKKGGTLQCRLVCLPLPIKEEDEDEGYFAQTLLMVNKGNGLVLKPQIVRLESASAVTELLKNFCAEIGSRDMCPLQISVPDAKTEYFLKTFCNILNIKLVREHKPLRELNIIWQNLFENYAKESGNNN